MKEGQEQISCCSEGTWLLELGKREMMIVKNCQDITPNYRTGNIINMVQMIGQFSLYDLCDSLNTHTIL